MASAWSSIARQIDPMLAIDRALPMEDVVATAAMRPRFFAGAVVLTRYLESLLFGLEPLAALRHA